MMWGRSVVQVHEEKSRVVVILIIGRIVLKWRQIFCFIEF